ncbi:MAG TPA: Hg(II)-responsive transcriptional regulator [Chromatiales bacterium]|nr:Hg(II)-responsive transcriptional regulator [Chromatiales bacterium]
MPSTALTIGQLARCAGVHVETIRYYQRRGLVSEPPKPACGYRVYPEETIQRVQFIKRAQRLGFSLREIAELLALGDGRCSDVSAMAARKCRQIEAQIADLQAMRDALLQLLRACREHGGQTRCPMVTSLVSMRSGDPQT